MPSVGYILQKVGTCIGVSYATDPADRGTVDQSIITTLSGISSRLKPYNGDENDMRLFVSIIPPGVGQVGIEAWAEQFYYNGAQIDYSSGGFIIAIGQIMNIYA
jgi:hypothetical protein